MSESSKRPSVRAPIPRAGHAVRGAVVVAVALGATACSTSRDTRTADEREQDRAIVERAKAMLEADPTVYAAHIDITAKRGVVSLGGWVMSDAESRAAKLDIARVPGVRRVDDRIDVQDATLER
jgi:osmotically-inducible protein OsmY